MGEAFTSSTVLQDNVEDILVCLRIKILEQLQVYLVLNLVVRAIPILRIQQHLISREDVFSCQTGPLAPEFENVSTFVFDPMGRDIGEKTTQSRPLQKIIHLIPKHVSPYACEMVSGWVIHQAGTYRLLSLFFAEFKNLLVFQIPILLN